MKKILELGPKGCVILLILFSVSCNPVKWSWEADPYAADHNSQALYGVGETVIPCESPEFSGFTCFTNEDIAELVFNIKRLERVINKSRVSKRTKRRYRFHINKALSKLTRDEL
jgi:hypothetical protein